MNNVICHISTVHKLFDNRIFFKECISLTEEGYITHLLISTKKNTIINKIKIDQLPLCKNRMFRFIIKDLIALVKALRINAELYHIHDPELLWYGWIIRKIFKKKVIFDVHEFVREQIENKGWLKRIHLNKLFSRLYVMFEKYLIKPFNAIILAVPEMVSAYHNHKNKVVIRNLPILKKIQNVVQEDTREKQMKKIIIYPGTLSHDRGITNLIISMKYLSSEFELWLLGNWSNTSYEEKCKSLKGWEKTKYLGKKKPDDVYKLLKLSDVGVQLVLPTVQYNKFGYPVKVFEYLAAGLPVVISDFESKRKLFGNSVYFTDPSDPIKIADSIREVVHDKVLRKKLIHNGYNFVEKYSWENEKKILINLYTKVLSSNNSRR